MLSKVWDENISPEWCFTECHNVVNMNLHKNHSPWIKIICDVVPMTFCTQVSGTSVVAHANICSDSVTSKWASRNQYFGYPNLGVPMKSSLIWSLELHNGLNKVNPVCFAGGHQVYQVTDNATWCKNRAWWTLSFSLYFKTDRTRFRRKLCHNLLAKLAVLLAQIIQQCQILIELGQNNVIDTADVFLSDGTRPLPEPKGLPIITYQRGPMGFSQDSFTVNVINH